MEHLTKQQIILLALLVAIVTSITTGIVTVSLSDQSSGVSNTIYRVVEKTIATVAPTDSPVRKIVEPVVVKPKENTDLPLTDIVDKVGKSFIRVYTGDLTKIPETQTEASQYITLGIALGTKGTVIIPTLPTTVSANTILFTFATDGTKIPLSIESSTLPSGLAMLKVKDAKDIGKIAPAVLGNFSVFKLGSNVVALGGKENDNIVSTGIITEFENLPNSTDATTAKSVAVTNIELSGRLAGWILLNTTGQVTGFLLSGSDTEKHARYIDAILVKNAAGEAI